MGKQTEKPPIITLKDVKSTIGKEELNDLKTSNPTEGDVQEVIEKTIENKENTEKEATVGIYNERGKRREQTIFLQGLSSEMLPPITKRKIATYELVGKDEKDPLTGSPNDIKPPMIIPASIMVYDPFERDPLKRHKTIKNVIGVENRLIGGVMVPHETIADIFFDNGFKTVHIEREYLTYVILELHPLNETSRFRNKTGDKAAFRRVDVDRRKWLNGTTGQNLSFEAERMVVDMIKKEDIIDYATAARIPTAGRMISGESDGGGIKQDLRVFARQNPREFLQLNKNNKMSIRISVMDAIELGLIEYSPDTKRWVFVTDGETIGTVLAGQEPTDSLISMFSKEEYKIPYGVLQHQLNYWE